MNKKAGETFGGDGYVYGIDCGHGFMGLSPHSLRPGLGLCVALQKHEVGLIPCLPGLLGVEHGPGE